MQAAAQRIEQNGSVLRLFDRAAFAQTRYPRLQAVFERMVAASLESLREACIIPPQYIYKDAQAEPLREALTLGDGGGIVALFAVPEWSSRLYFTVDRAFVFTLTEAIFGGDGLQPPYAAERDFSQIEKNIVRASVVAAARALQSSLSPVAGLSFNFERLESDPDTIAEEELAGQAVVARFELRAVGRAGEMRVAIPHAAIRSARAAKGARHDDSAEREETARRLRDEIRSAGVKLTAVLEQRKMTLGELATLQVGQLLPLNARVDGQIQLTCDNEPMLLCGLGQSEGAYALRVDEILTTPKGAQT